MKNSAGRGGFYPPRLKVEEDKKPSEIHRILHILCKPNSAIAKYDNRFLYSDWLYFLYSFQIFSLLKLVNVLAAISLFVKKHNLVPRFSRSMVQ